MPPPFSTHRWLIYLDISFIYLLGLVSADNVMPGCNHLLLLRPLLGPRSHCGHRISATGYQALVTGPSLRSLGSLPVPRPHHLYTTMPRPPNKTPPEGLPRHEVDQAQLNIIVQKKHLLTCFNKNTSALLIHTL